MTARGGVLQLFSRHPSDRSGGTDPVMSAIEARVLQRASHYFPMLEGSDVFVVPASIDYRPASRIYRFDLCVGPGARPVTSVIAKVPLSRSDPEAGATAGSYRPRLGPLTSARRKYELEFRAMSSLQAHLEQRPVPHLTAVKVLDQLADEGALIFERVIAPTLVELTRRSVRQANSRRPPPLLSAYRDAGRLLRTWHTIPAPSWARPLRRRAVDVADALGAYVKHLSGSGVTALVLRHLETDGAGLVLEVLPDELPVAWCHGDFAARNVFVSRRGQVSTFDILGARSAPIYEDVAYFLVALNSSPLNVATQGMAARRHSLASYEQAFLVGYFGGRPPLEVLRVYQLLVLLDRWASVRKRNVVGPAAGVRQRMQEGLVDRFFRLQVEQILAELAARNETVRRRATRST